MKKVLFVINTLGHAGAEVALLELLRRLGEKELELSLYVLTEQGELVTDVPSNVKLLNKNFCAAPVLTKEGRNHLRKKTIKAAFSKNSIFKNFSYIVKNGLKMAQNRKIQVDKLLWRVLSDGADELKEEYDLAVAFLEGGSSYFVADHIKAKKKAAFIHIDYNLAGYTRSLDKDCFLKFDQIFTVSEEVKTHFLNAYPECQDNINVFHNMLNEERIFEKSKEEGGFDDDFEGIRILTVGRLVYQKGYDIAIEAMKLLKDTGKPIRWYVLGEGNLRSSLEYEIALAGLEKNFILVGAVKNPYPYYAQADIYAHCTRFEGKSIAIQEAQILGKPIVASDCSGNKEQIINGVDGILCDLVPEDIKEAILSLVEDKEAAALYGQQAMKKQIAYEEDMQMLLALL